MYHLIKFKPKCVHLITLLLLILMSCGPVTYTREQQRTEEIKTQQKGAGNETIFYTNFFNYSQLRRNRRKPSRG